MEFFGSDRCTVRADAKADVPAVAEALDIRDGDVVYELGSGDGRFLVWCARRFSRTQFVGIERNPLLFWYSRCKARLNGRSPNLSFRCENFFTTELAGANKAYVYLLNPVMDALLPKLERELPQARLVSRAFVFRARTARATIKLGEAPGSHGQNRLYVYEFN